jgi:hypothetical protein
VFLSSRQNGRMFQPNAEGCGGAGSRVFGASSEAASVLGSAGVSCRRLRDLPFSIITSSWLRAPKASQD